MPKYKQTSTIQLDWTQDAKKQFLRLFCQSALLDIAFRSSIELGSWWSCPGVDVDLNNCQFDRLKSDWLKKTKKKKEKRGGWLDTAVSGRIRRYFFLKYGGRSSRPQMECAVGRWIRLSAAATHVEHHWQRLYKFFLSNNLY